MRVLLPALLAVASSVTAEQCPRHTYSPSFSGNVTWNGWEKEWSIREANSITCSLPWKGGFGAYWSLSSEGSLSPEAGQTTTDAFTARLVAEQGLPPTASIAYFDSSLQFNKSIDVSQAQLSGSLAQASFDAGVFTAAMSTFFVDVIEFEDINNDATFTPGTDKIVQSISLRHQAWNTLCSTYTPDSSPFAIYNISTKTPPQPTTATPTSAATTASPTASTTISPVSPTTSTTISPASTAAVSTTVTPVNSTLNDGEGHHPHPPRPHHPTPLPFSIQATLSNVVGVLANDAGVLTPRSMKIDLQVRNFPYIGYNGTQNTRLAIAAIVASAQANASVAASFDGSSTISSNSGDGTNKQVSLSWQTSAYVNDGPSRIGVKSSGWQELSHAEAQVEVDIALDIIFSAAAKAGATVDYKKIYFSFDGVQPTSVYWDPLLASGALPPSTPASSDDSSSSSLAVGLGVGLTLGLLGLLLLIYLSYRVYVFGWNNCLHRQPKSEESRALVGESEHQPIYVRSSDS